MDQAANVLPEAERRNADGAEAEIYCVCRSADVSRFMM